LRLERIAHALILAGAAIIFLIALAIPIQLMLSGGSFSGGGCVVIFFLPICFGLGEQPLLMVILAMSLAIAIILLSYLLLRPLTGRS